MSQLHRTWPFTDLKMLDMFLLSLFMVSTVLDSEDKLLLVKWSKVTQGESGT